MTFETVLRGQFEITSSHDQESLMKRNIDLGQEKPVRVSLSSLLHSIYSIGARPPELNRYNANCSGDTTWERILVSVALYTACHS